MRIPVWSLAALIVVSLTSSADSAGICTQDCIVEITGLQASYVHGAKVEFSGQFDEIFRYGRDRYTSWECPLLQRHRDIDFLWRYEGHQNSHPMRREIRS